MGYMLSEKTVKHPNSLSDNMERVFFKPWVGENYESGGIFGKRILVVGESHYCDDDECERCSEESAYDGCHEFTNKVVRQIIDGETTRWSGTFRKFEKSLVGDKFATATSEQIWQSIAFYNYLQVAVAKARQAGDLSEYDKSEDAFFDVLNKLQPDVMFVWGVTRMYDNRPSKGWTVGSEITVDGYKVLNGYYTLDNGHRVRAVWTYHPSAGYSPEWWNKVIKEVL